MLSDGGFVGSYELVSCQKPEIANPNSESRHERGARDLATTWAVTEFERPDRLIDFEPHSTTETTTADHLKP